MYCYAACIMRSAIYAILLLTLCPLLIAQSHPGVPAISATSATLRDTHLPSPLRQDILAQLQKSILEALSHETNGDHTVAHAQKIALDSRVRFLQPSHRGPSAIILSSEQCSPNGVNCLSWVFMTKDGHAVLAFEADGSGILIEPTFHHGMPDLSSEERYGHSTDGEIEFYEFNGKTYSSAYCFESTVDETGKRNESPHEACSDSQ